MIVPVDQFVGQTFGQYRPGQLLGQGSLSTVYKAQQQTTGRAVMLSLFTLPQGCTGRARERFMARFAQIASAVSRLKHPNIVPLYDFGEEYGYPYMVSPVNESGSLSTLLQKQGRCSSEKTLGILKQVAEALDYAHQNHVVHGSLKPSAILVDSQQRVQVAGFGLAQMLAMQGIGNIQHSHPHLFSVAGTLVANPMYIAPEVVQGAQADARSDIYSLGIVLFEMLTGYPPFSGSDPVQVALQHVAQNVPSLLSAYPEAPSALDLILQKAVERDPAQRLTSAGKLVAPFERVLNLIRAAPASPQPVMAAQMQQAAVMPERTATAPKQQWGGGGLPPTTTSAKMPAMNVAPAGVPLESAKWPRQVPHFTGKNEAVQAPAQAPFSPPDMGNDWLAGQPTPPPGGKQPGTLARNAPPTRASASGKSGQSSRRKLLMATGGAVAASAIGVVGYNLLMHKGNTGTANGNAMTAQNGNTKKTNQQGQTPNNQQKPAATTAPAGHTGTVVAMAADLAVNSSKNFTDANGKDSILVHLPNGDFVAYERACTHQGVDVNYHTDTHTLICPLHGAIFDPAKGATVLQGPARVALTMVNVKVNADGTVTM